MAKETRLTRRCLFEVAAYAAVATCLSKTWSTASAQEQGFAIDGSSCAAMIPKKATKASVEHVTPSKSSKQCDKCRLFLPPDQCVVVEGPTTADSSCDLWADKSSKTPIPCRPDQLKRL